MGNEPPKDLADLVKRICSDTSWLKASLSRIKLTHTDVEAIYVSGLYTGLSGFELGKLTEANVPLFLTRREKESNVYQLLGEVVVYTKDWVIHHIRYKDSYHKILPRNNLPPEIPISISGEKEIERELMLPEP